MNWYALFVETGKEEIVQKYLQLSFQNSSLRSFVPKRLVPEKKGGHVKDVAKTMFPGYVLIQTEMTENTYYILKKIPRIYKILRNGYVIKRENEKSFATISEEEINPIIQLTGDNGLLQYSKLYVEKSRIIVVSGPLKGKEGIIKKVDPHKNRAKIVLQFLGSEKIIDVGVDILKLEPSQQLN